MDPQEETFLQEVHQLKCELSKEKAIRSDIQAENEQLHAEIAEWKSKLNNEKLNEKISISEVRSLKDQISTLTAQYESEKQCADEKIRELEEKLKNTNVVKASVDETVYEKVMSELSVEKQHREDFEQKYLTLSEEMCQIIEEKLKLERILKESAQQLEETREALEVKKESLAEVTESLKEAQEEKAVLNMELSALKAGPTDSLDRGNSLFKEVEDRRKQLAVAYNSLKNKYMAMKNAMSAKNLEINRLKGQVTSLKSQDLGLDKIMEKSNCALRASLNKRIKELEQMAAYMEKWKESPQIINITESDNLGWVNHLVNQARNETRKVLADYEKVSSDQMLKALEYRKTELEFITLKSESVRKDGRIESLETEVADLKSKLKENVSQYKSYPEDSILNRKSNKTVRFANSSMEETCNETNIDTAEHS